MAAALPPVTDCGCSSSTTSSTPTSVSTCCPLAGTEDPNLAGVVPPDTSVRATYLQLVDLINGPPIQTWWWNPTLLVWQ